ncbi:PQQ-dependent sugar dehydrogenase [Paragemmobacter straminiformis]
MQPAARPLQAAPLDTGQAPVLSAPQSGPEAAAIRATLGGITLPQGFSISLYAIVPGARQMAVGPKGTVFVGTRDADLWAVTDTNGDNRADRVTTFAPGLAKTMPNGVCFDGKGGLFSVEQNRITLYPDAEAAVENPSPAADEIVALGTLIPPSEEATNHAFRVCTFGPDGRLYVSLGQPYNVPPPEKLALYDKTGIGGIIALNPDGSGRQVYTRGLRNSVGIAFHPETGALWFTDNQVDRMGNDIPPGEINRQTAPAQHFGFPWFGGGHIRTEDYAADTPPADAVFPVVETVAHAADLGLAFYTGNRFPSAYRNAIFSAQHGSWDRDEPVGARVMVTTFDAAGKPDHRPFASGWLAPDGSYLGRPVDVAQMPDGALLVSDDQSGAIYRIDYTRP